jgi:hypothetical protein
VGSHYTTRLNLNSIGQQIMSFLSCMLMRNEKNSFKPLVKEECSVYFSCGLWRCVFYDDIFCVVIYINMEKYSRSSKKTSSTWKTRLERGPQSSEKWKTT